MSNLPQIIITADSEVVLKKKAAWSEVGLTVHNANIALEQKAKEALSLLVLPKTIDDINAAESNLKDVKTKLSIIELERKAVTSKFDAVTSALMTHEKLVKDALPAYTNAIVAIKKIHEAEQAKLKAEAEAEKQWKEQAVNFIHAEFNRFRDLIADQCQKAYEYALGKDISPDVLGAYLVKVKANKTEKDFTIFKPEKMTQLLFDFALKQVDMVSPADMLITFHCEVDKKFEFYNVALKNKEAAIQASKEAELAAQAERLAVLANANIATRLETIATSTDAVVDSGIKELKKKFAIDMPDDDQSALLIITAFVTNFAAAKEGVRVKSMMSLSIGQMGTALAWLKNKDNAFSFTGINFKIDDKL